jgi:hypothetical protein
MSKRDLIEHINDQIQLENEKKSVDKAHQRPKSVGTREKGR